MALVFRRAAASLGRRANTQLPATSLLSNRLVSSTTNVQHAAEAGRPRAVLSLFDILNSAIAVEDDNAPQIKIERDTMPLYLDFQATTPMVWPVRAYIHISLSHQPRVTSARTLV
jgi:hypothetical protein